MSAKKKKLVLLDSHAIIHRAYHALPDFSTKKGEPTGALYGLSAMLIKIIKDLKPDYIVAAYDLPQKTFRHETYKEYKAGRKEIDEELIVQLKRSRDVFEAFNIPIYDKPGFEADDVIGTIVDKVKDKKDIDTIIASGDLDTLQLVSGKKVKVYTLKRGLSDTILYDEDAVVERYGFPPKLLPDYKGLRGDPSDNIIGIKGIGEKTATILIKNFGTIENIYKTLKKNPEKFEKAGLTPRILKLLEEGEEEALFSKTLAQIRLDTPITFSLPPKEWKDAVDVKKAEELFKELEFKALGERFRKLFGEKEEAKATELSAAAQEGSLPDTSQEVPREEIEKIGIALWLLNSDLNNPTFEDILDYGDTTSFEEVKKKILKEIKEKNLEYVYKNIELPIVPIVKKMEERGVLINTKYLQKLSKEYHKTLSAIKKKIWKLAGEEFNINSPKQLAEVLFDKLELSVKAKTAGGARSTRISELEKLQGSHPIIDEIVSYRELQKLLSMYIDTLPQMTNKDNRLHAHFIQTGTTTGRFSSVNPNLQNIPIKGELGKKIRNAFITSPLYTLASFDYSQIDLRVVAIFSKDPYLLEIFREGKDIHTGVAMKVFGVDEAGVTGEMRRRAKVINFGIVYGMGISALQKNLKSTRAEAKEFYYDYFTKFPNLGAYLEEIKTLARRKGYTETLFGRKRYFPDIESKVPMLKAAAERMATNFPIQGTSADIFKLAIKDVDKALTGAGLVDKSHLILQVHDELVYEIKDEVLGKAARVIREAMENVIPPQYLKGKGKIPIKVHVSAGGNWGEMTPL